MENAEKLEIKYRGEEFLEKVNPARSVIVYMGKHGDLALRVGSKISKETYRMFHWFLRDYFLRRERARKDAFYHPIWHPLQMIMARVDAGDMLGMEVTFEARINKSKVDKEVTRNGRTNITEYAGS